jgi:hypothetical protein
MSLGARPEEFLTYDRQMETKMRVRRREEAFHLGIDETKRNGSP